MPPTNQSPANPAADQADIQPTNDPVADLSLPGDNPAFDPAPTDTPTDPKPADQPSDAEPPAWFKQWTENVFTPMQEKIQQPAAPSEPEAPKDPETPAPRKAPKTMEELDAYIAERYAEIEKERNREKEQQTEAEKEQQQLVDKHLDEQVAALQKDNILPEYKEGEKNPFHASLYAYAYYLGTDNLLAVGQSIKGFHDRGEVFDLQSTQKEGKPVFRRVAGQAGGQAPVGSSMSSTGRTASGPDYKQIHNARSLDDVVDLFNSIEG